MLLGPLEERLLDLFWRSRDEASVREVQERLGEGLAYTTVMTTLDRLFKKGLLSRRRDGLAYRYTAQVSRDGYATSQLRRGLDRLLRRGTAEPLLASFVDAVGEHDRQLLPALEKLVRDKERALKRRRGR